ncbi:MAG: ArsR/SmtB family transcription factor [Polyangiales bacterium]
MKTIADRMAALGNETRLSIYRLLVRAGQSGRSVSDVREHLEMPASTLSHHLHKLIRVGLVQQERQGTTLICRADYSVMAATFDVFAQECCVDEGADSAPCCPPPTES